MYLLRHSDIVSMPGATITRVVTSSRWPAKITITIIILSSYYARTICLVLQKIMGKPDNYLDGKVTDSNILCPPWYDYCTLTLTQVFEKSRLLDPWNLTLPLQDSRFLKDHLPPFVDVWHTWLVSKPNISTMPMRPDALPVNWTLPFSPGGDGDVFTLENKTYDKKN